MTVQRNHPPTRAMREKPDIEQLRRQASELLKAYCAQALHGKGLLAPG